jgi:hypothetical protein
MLTPPSSSLVSVQADTTARKHRSTQQPTRDVLKHMDRATNPESIDIGRSYAEAGALKSLGSKPLIVLTHSPKWKMVPNLPMPVLAKLEGEDQRLQRSFLKLSRRSRQMIAKSAGHELPEEDPDFVVNGILDAVRMTRNR